MENNSERRQLAVQRRWPQAASEDQNYPEKPLNHRFSLSKPAKVRDGIPSGTQKTASQTPPFDLKNRVKTKAIVNSGLNPRGQQVLRKMAFKSRKTARNDVWIGFEVNSHKRKTPQTLACSGVVIIATDCFTKYFWRRRRDSNPRSRFCPDAPLAGECLRPLGHVSALSN